MGKLHHSPIKAPETCIQPSMSCAVAYCCICQDDDMEILLPISKPVTPRMRGQQGSREVGGRKDGKCKWDGELSFSQKATRDCLASCCSHP